MTAIELTAPGVAPVLDVTGLTVGYEDAMAVRDLTLHVGSGEVVALLGANGAGKTTTLRALSGGLLPSAGRVLLAGTDITRRSAQAIARSGVVHMTDRRSVFHGLTVAEHLRLSYRGQRLDADLAYERFPALRRCATGARGCCPVASSRCSGWPGRSPGGRSCSWSTNSASAWPRSSCSGCSRWSATTYGRPGAAAILVEQHVQLALAVSDRGYVLAHGQLVLTQSADQLLRNRVLLAESYLGEQEAGNTGYPRMSRPELGK